jgi:hypothetical protein
MQQEFIPASMNAVELYSDFKLQLETLKSESSSLVFDYASVKGSKDARSHIAGLRKMCGALERARKDAKHDAQEYARLVDSKAKDIASELRGLISMHEAPLLEIEAKEQARIDAIKARMAVLEVPAILPQPFASNDWQALLNRVEAFVIDASLAEFMAAAAIAKDAAIAQIKPRLAEARQKEHDAAELARLQEVERARLQKEREEQIAKAAAERATQEAEEKAERERLRQEQAVLQAQKEKAEAETRAANAEKAAKEKAERVLKEKADKEQKEQVAREADKKHKARINNEAMAALVANGIAEDVAKAVVCSIAKRLVAHVQINY